MEFFFFFFFFFFFARKFISSFPFFFFSCVDNRIMTSTLSVEILVRCCGAPGGDNSLFFIVGKQSEEERGEGEREENENKPHVCLCRYLSTQYVPLF